MLNFFIYDVFTDRPFHGNPLAIVMGADGLSTGQMQVIARQFNLSETIFVMRPRNVTNSCRVRIFFPTAEIPFAGHPTIGCALHLASGRDVDLVLEEEAGPVPVAVRSGQAELTAPKIPTLRGTKPEAESCSRAVGLPQGAIGFGEHRPAVWEGGPAFVYLPVAHTDALSAARPVEPYWSQLMEKASVDSAYLYCVENGGYRARMFSPTAGIPEDPATGSAAAILSAQLLASRALNDGETRLTVRQGVEMGRPSFIGLTVAVQNGNLNEIRVSGRAVQVASGSIRIPEEW